MQSDTASPPFLSTNDILTSSYMCASNCDVGLMAINYRKRLEGLTDDLAGGVVKCKHCNISQTENMYHFWSVYFHSELKNRVKSSIHINIGNYEGAIAYQKNDFEAPELIRESLMNAYRRRNYDRSGSSQKSAMWQLL